MKEKINDGKQIALILMSLIFLIITYFVFSKYVFKTEMPSLTIDFSEQDNVEAKVQVIKSKTKNIKIIDREFFKNEKYRNLEYYNYEKMELSKFKKGKVNPFLRRDEKQDIIDDSAGGIDDSVDHTIVEAVEVISSVDIEITDDDRNKADSNEILIDDRLIISGSNKESSRVEATGTSSDDDDLTDLDNL